MLNVILIPALLVAASIIALPALERYWQRSCQSYDGILGPKPWDIKARDMYGTDELSYLFITEEVQNRLHRIYLAYCGFMRARKASIVLMVGAVLLFVADRF